LRFITSLGVQKISFIKLPVPAVCGLAIEALQPDEAAMSRRNLMAAIKAAQIQSKVQIPDKYLIAIFGTADLSNVDPSYFETQAEMRQRLLVEAKQGEEKRRLAEQTEKEKAEFLRIQEIRERSLREKAQKDAEDAARRQEEEKAKAARRERIMDAAVHYFLYGICAALEIALIALAFALVYRYSGRSTQPVTADARETCQRVNSSLLSEYLQGDDPHHYVDKGRKHAKNGANIRCASAPPQTGVNTYDVSMCYICYY